MASKKNSEEAPLTGAELAAKLARQFGSQRVEDPNNPVTVKGLPLGVIALDNAIGIKGVPIGKLTEIMGDFATGKSLLGLLLLAETQRKKGIAILIDAEFAYNSTRAAELGIDTRNIVVVHPQTQEDAYKYIQDIIKIVRDIDQDQLLTIVWDSIAALKSNYEQGKGIQNSANMASNARVNSSSLKHVLEDISFNSVTLVFINQIRKKIGVMFGKDWDTVGGEAIKYYSSLRLHAKINKNIVEDGKVVGVKGAVEISKNRFAPPFQKIELTLHFDKRGLDPYSGLFSMFVQKGWLKPTIAKSSGKERKGHYSYKDGDEDITENSFSSFLDDHSEIVKQLKESF